tara:strand:+ start:427 stop:1110 length:684 start_codon:yes stop_codon:yes gene_type:complete
MSIKVMTMVFDAQLKSNQKLVMLALADHANDMGGRVFPSIERVAHKVCLSKRQVQRIMNDLRKEGLIHMTHKASRHRPREYRIDLFMLKAIMVEYEVPVRGDNMTPLNGQVGVTPTSPKPSVVKLTDNKVNLRTNVPHPDSQHPSILVYRSVTKRYPKKELYTTIIKAIGDKTEDDLRPYHQEWLERGYNPLSIKWLVDWAISGMIPGVTSKKATSIDTLKEAFNAD